jgi:hypothetical protein
MCDSIHARAGWASGSFQGTLARRLARHGRALLRETDHRSGRCRDGARGLPMSPRAGGLGVGAIPSATPWLGASPVTFSIARRGFAPTCILTGR